AVLSLTIHQGLVVFFYCRTFASLAFSKNCMLLPACNRRFQVNPAAMQRAGRAAAGFRLGFSIAASLALQRGSEARTLLRVIAKEGLQLRVVKGFCCLLKTFLPIFESFD